MYEVLLQKQLTLDSGKTTHMTTVGRQKKEKEKKKSSTDGSVRLGHRKVG